MNIRTLSFDRDRFADWRHWLPPVLEVLLVVLLAAQAARLLWMLLVPIAPIGASAATMPIQAAAPSLPMVDLFFRSASHAASSGNDEARSEEHTSELQSLIRISYAVFCLKKKKPKH